MASDGWHKRNNVPSIISAVVKDEARSLVALCSFSALTLSVCWFGDMKDNQCHLSPKFLFWNKCRNKTEENRGTGAEKMAKSTEMPFGLWTPVGPRQHVLGEVHTGATWRLPLNHPCAVAMGIFIKLL